MDLRRVYKYLQLQTFDEEEFGRIFDDIMNIRHHHASTSTSSGNNNNKDQQQDEQEFTNENDIVSSEQTQQQDTINQKDLRNFLIERIRQLERENGLPNVVRDDDDEETTINAIRSDYADREACQLLKILLDNDDNKLKKEDRTDDETLTTHDDDDDVTMTKQQFTSTLLDLTSKVDMKRMLPITVSMLLVGSSVGIITPVMPFVVENLGLTPGQYGIVVSAFAAAKMTCNVPSAILVERHGRKPYLVYSLSVIALGVGGIGLATQFEHLWLCRLLTGGGVAALSTAATLCISDISTPRNRASTMAPIMSAFAAGTALGPALGGVLADTIGVNATFYLVGVSFLGLTAVNHLLLTETKAKTITFPWQDESLLVDQMEKQTIREAVGEAVGQWTPLMADHRVRNVVIMNGFYWIALAGSQMTLLPLLLTDPSGLAMSATGVGQVYMGMSAIQVFGNPILAKIVDRIGKGPAIVAGSSMIAFSMGLLPVCTDMYQLAGTLGVWATGSTLLSTAPVACISDLVSDEKRAQAIALLRTGGDVGFLIGAAGMGALADWTGLDGAMQTSAGVLLTATGWFATRQLLNAKGKP